MCLIVFAWRPQTAQPLLLLANRDEFHARPTAALAEWTDEPGLYAGRDLQAGGTWLGLRGQRFAALTNIRDPRQPLGTRSRGELPLDFLRGEQTPQTFLQHLAPRAADYSGFNLLLGDGQTLWHFNAREGRPQRLTEGVYGLSNASLDSPWPKLVRCRSALAARLDADDARLWEILGDTREADDDSLPDTGVELALERLLSAPFILGEGYGTRASSLLRGYADGRRAFSERRFGPNGQTQGETRLLLPG